MLRVSVIADAQRGDVYSADFLRDSPGEPLACTRASEIEPLTRLLARLEPGTLVLGPALDSAALRARLPPEFLADDAALNYPDGRGLVELSRREWAAGRRENAWLLEPRYLRRSAAEEKLDAQKPATSD